MTLLRMTPLRMPLHGAGAIVLVLTLLAAPLALACGGGGGGESGGSSSTRRRSSSDDERRYTVSSTGRGTLRGGSSERAGGGGGGPTLRESAEARRAAGTATGTGLAAEMLARELRAERREPVRDETAEGQRIASSIASLAERPPSGDEDECEQMWEATVVAATEDGHRMDESPRARRTFVAGCRRAPPALRQCMSPSYRRQHFELCGEVEARTEREMVGPDGQLRLPEE